MDLDGTFFSSITVSFFLLGFREHARAKGTGKKDEVGRVDESKAVFANASLCA
jgi:hypothetical protein